MIFLVKAHKQGPLEDGHMLESSCREILCVYYFFSVPVYLFWSQHALFILINCLNSMQDCKMAKWQLNIDSLFHVEWEIILTK